MIQKFISQKRLVYGNIFLTLIALLLFILSPQYYSYNYVLFIVVLFIGQTLPFVLIVSKGNFVNFYTLFFTSYFFINFFYPAVVYPINAELLSVFTIPFNHDYITKGTALAFLASACLITGASLKYRNKGIYAVIPKNYTGVQKTTLAVTSLFVVFLLVVGPAFLSGDFRGASSASAYVLMLLKCIMLLASILFFKQWKYNSGLTKVIFWLTNLLYIFIFLRTGDRGPALFQIILLFALYAVYVKPIPKKYLAVIGIAGILFMEIIGFGRVSNTETEGTIISRGVERVAGSDLLVLTTSFIVNSRNLYVGVEYAETEGINYGETHLTYLLSPVPFGQRTFIVLTGQNIRGSAGFFTTLGFGDNPPYGLGTNLVADVYIAFGLIGVMIMFFLLGFIVEKYRNRLGRGGIHVDIIYFGLLTTAIVYPRDAILAPLNIIVWAIVLSYFLRRVNVMIPYIRSYYRKLEY